jgi:pimeloyl-ACP methyl ester carboxylesterase
VDRPGAPGHRDRRAAAQLTDPRLRVCLERIIELDNVRVRLRDWHGYRGPLIHVAHPTDKPSIVEALATTLAPHWRVLSVSSRPDVAYQVAVADLVGVLDQFGFVRPVVLGEQLSCHTVLILAAWYPTRVGTVILVEPQYARPTGDTLEARALRDCPPDWPQLRANVRCPIFVAADVPDVERFLAELP